ncbi:zinc-ribbon domain-containing protein [Pelagovum pacificum]|uniref:Thioredoxin n=1 Tax=Pelagovum pacificum TaxID=2588711 RepID=A0A5C5GBX5_9RHOB|nr:zinc-ribbon domain-containing protein [Pelagovum pacificum]QQA42402.1 zinc-ribbon domain-containing protein [Pelagovum pacificum]TNY31484.1 thioredoxin [Pelagovum pacificum]
MRLICPNCGAQYEVPDDVIPDSGRDVQCSNCGQTWFESPGGSVAEEANPEPPPQAATATKRPPPPDPEPEPEPEPEDHPEPEPTPEPNRSEDLQPDPEAPVPPATAARERQRRGLDPEIANVLQEERRDSEALRRRPPPDPMESQTDFELDQPSDGRQKRVNRLHGAPEKAPAGSDASRREMLPDIEEINSSLRSTGERMMPESSETEAEAVAREKRKGFRLGFGIVLLIAAAAIMTYLRAPDIANAVPAAQPALESYVTTVDRGRVWLDQTVLSLLERMEQADSTEPAVE